MTLLKHGIFLLILSTSLHTNSFAATETLDQIAAIVNDDVVTQTELENQMEVVRQQIRSQRVQAPPTAILYKQVLEREIVKHLQLQLAKATGIRATDADISNLVTRIAAQNQLSVRELQQKIEADGLSFASFRNNLRQQRIISQLQQREVHARITITDQEIESFLATQAVQGDANTQYEVSHILFSIPDASTPAQVKQVKQKADAVLKKLRAGDNFKQMAISTSDSSQALKDGGSLGWRSAGELPTLFAAEIYKMKKGQISSILRSPSGFHILKLDNKKAGEKHIVTQSKARHILIKPNELTPEHDVISRLRQIRSQIIAGGLSFDRAARTNSDDKGSAANGGDLGWVTPGTMVPEFEAQMDKLKANEISQPFQSMFGYHIVQVLERKEVDDSEEYSRAKARELLRQRKIEENLEAWIRQLRDQAYVDIKTL